VKRDEIRRGECQKLASRAKDWSVQSTPTPDLEYFDSNAFFEEVCFALKANRFHPFEWVPDFEGTVATEAEEQSVSAKIDVVTHHCRVHSDQFDGEGFDNKFHLDCDCFADNLGNLGFWKPVD